MIGAESKGHPCKAYSKSLVRNTVVCTERVVKRTTLSASPRHFN